MKRKSLTIIAILGLLVSTSCGEAKKEPVKKETKKVEVQEKEAEPEVKQIVEITVEAVGESMAEIAFEPKSLSIPKNSRVKLTLKNVSSAAGMLHNFVLVELGTGQEIATAGIKAGNENNFIPKDKRVIAGSAVADLGESVTIEFDAPKAGSYHYICTYPGHYPMMIGRMNVE